MIRSKRLMTALSALVTMVGAANLRAQPAVTVAVDTQTCSYIDSCLSSGTTCANISQETMEATCNNLFGYYCDNGVGGYDCYDSGSSYQCGGSFIRCGGQL